MTFSLSISSSVKYMFKIEVYTCLHVHAHSENGGFRTEGNSSCCYIRGVPRIWQEGGPRTFFLFGNLHDEAMCFARGIRGHAPPRKKFKMVQFGAFWCII